PFEFPRRIFILDEAQTIHWQAVDLLLKVLEEPPETTSFILICPNAFELRSKRRWPRAWRQAVWPAPGLSTPPSTNAAASLGWIFWKRWRAAAPPAQRRTGG